MNREPDANLTLVKQMLVCLFYLRFASLLAIFQSYCDGDWKWQGAQLSLVECSLAVCCVRLAGVTSLLRGRRSRFLVI